jgi:hypothetical protein
MAVHQTTKIGQNERKQHAKNASRYSVHDENHASMAQQLKKKFFTVFLQGSVTSPVIL